MSLRRGRTISALLLLFSISVIALYGTYQLNYPVASDKTFRLTVRVIYENRSPNEAWSLRDEDLVVWLFMNNSWQEAHLIEISHPIRIISKDSDGNTFILLDISDKSVPPLGRICFNVSYRLIYRERSVPDISEDLSGELDDIPPELREKYCKPTSLWHHNITIIEEIAKNIAGDERRVLTIVKEFIKWIASNINYATSDVPRYPNETLSQNLGDCDDQANLLITLCRAVGIPAHLQVGCIYVPGEDGRYSYWSGHLVIREVKVGWHGWAMVYVPPWGWLPVDLTYVDVDLRHNPLGAITRSAVVKHYTFQYLNITVSDYISETISTKNLVEGSMLYIYEEYAMELEEETICPKLPLIRPLLPTMAGGAPIIRILLPPG